jgi:hypothetical protein
MLAATFCRARIRAMNDSTQNSDTLAAAGGFVRIVGWAICAASIFFALGDKSAAPPYVVPFWLSLAVLVGGSVFYFIARLVSTRWKSKKVRSYFSPYIVGATIWLLLFLLFWILDRIAG